MSTNTTGEFIPHDRQELTEATVHPRLEKEEARLHVKVETTRLPGVLTLRPNVHLDERGFFTRTWDGQVARAAGLPDFVQDGQSRSAHGVIRALHLRVGAGESKLVRCARGRTVSFVVTCVRAHRPSASGSRSCLTTSIT